MRVVCEVEVLQVRSSDGIQLIMSQPAWLHRNFSEFQWILLTEAICGHGPEASLRGCLTDLGTRPGIWTDGKLQLPGGKIPTYTDLEDLASPQFQWDNVNPSRETKSVDRDLSQKEAKKKEAEKITFMGRLSRNGGTVSTYSTNPLVLHIAAWLHRKFEDRIKCG